MIGLAERTDESVLIMKHLLGLGNVYYGKKCNIRAAGEGENPEQAIRAIEEFNECDVALYQYAERRFEDLVKVQGPHFDAHVQRFQRLNRPVSALYGPYDQIYQTLLGIPWARKTGLSIRRVLRNAKLTQS